MLAQINTFRPRAPWFWLILALAVVLRVWIGTYSTDANDSHLHVIHKIMATGELPAVDDCWQCYHAKGFHYPAAVALARLNIHNPIDQLRLLHYANIALGIASLLLLWAWLRRRALDEHWKLALFALFALNPRFAAINAQVTNDSLVIFAATACFFFYAGFLESRRFLKLWLTVIFGALAVAAKASGIVVVLLVAIHLLVFAALHFRRLPRLKTQIAAFVLLVGAAGVLVPYAGYVQNAEQAGKALVNNIPKPPPLSWSEDTHWNQAGATSVVSSYLSFPWLSLVDYPYINNSVDEVNPYPVHRTNHWTQLYGRHLFSRYDRWPSPWATNGYWTTRAGQAAMALGLVPLGLVLAGLGCLAVSVLRGLRSGAAFRRLVADPEVFVAMTAVGLLALSLKLSLDFQTYGIMKAIYLYPAFIGILALMVRGTGVVRRLVPPGAGRVIHRLAIALVVVHVVDLAILGTDLQARYPERVQQLADYEPLELAPGQVRLDRLVPANLVEQDGRMAVNRSFSGAALTGGYRKYRFGFGTRAPASLIFALNGDYERFETAMALADEADGGDGVQFEIRGDSRLLYRGPMLIDGEVDRVSVDVSGVDLMRLRVWHLGNRRGDLANWLHPVLTRQDAAAAAR